MCRRYIDITFRVDKYRYLDIIRVQTLMPIRWLTVVTDSLYAMDVYFYIVYIYIYSYFGYVYIYMSILNLTLMKEEISRIDTELE